MNFYFKHRKFGAIFIEVSPHLGLIPLYSFSRWQNEHIVEFPWTKIILTPVHILEKEKEVIQNATIIHFKEITSCPNRGSLVTRHSASHSEN